MGTLKLFLIVLLSVLIGCGETVDDTVQDSGDYTTTVSPAPPHSAFHEFNLPSMTECPISVPSARGEVAAAPPLAALAGAALPIVSCGITVIDIASLAWGDASFLSQQPLWQIGSLGGWFCPVGGPAVKTVKILKSRPTLIARLAGYKFHAGNYREMFIKFTGINPGKITHAHHGIPQFLRERALKVGINIDQPWLLTWVPESLHEAISQYHRADWIKFVLNNPKATLDQWVDFMIKTNRKYGIGSYLDF